jgi:hypothetical protein
VFRDDGTYVPSVATDHRTRDRFDYIDVSNVPLDNCPVVSDKLSEMLSSVPVYHIPPSEMLSNIIFALCQSVTNKDAVGPVSETSVELSHHSLKHSRQSYFIEQR